MLTPEGTFWLFCSDRRLQKQRTNLITNLSVQGEAGPRYHRSLGKVIPKEDIFSIHPETLVQSHVPEVLQLGKAGQVSKTPVCKPDVKD